MRKALISTIFAAIAVAFAFAQISGTGSQDAGALRGAVLSPLAWEAWGKLIDCRAGVKSAALAQPNWGELAGVGSRIVLGVAFDNREEGPALEK